MLSLFLLKYFEKYLLIQRLLALGDYLMDRTKVAFLIPGLKITENEIIFDVKEHTRRIRRNSKIQIVVGIFFLWLLGMGILIVILALRNLKLEPIAHLKRTRKYLLAISKQTGKPIVYVNLPPELQNYGKQGEDPQLQKGYDKQVEDPQLQKGYDKQVEDPQLQKSKKFCPQCGKQIKQKGDFCTGCGIKI